MGAKRKKGTNKKSACSMERADIEKTNREQVKKFGGKWGRKNRPDSSKGRIMGGRPLKGKARPGTIPSWSGERDQTRGGKKPYEGREIGTEKEKSKGRKAAWKKVAGPGAVPALICNSIRKI